MINTISRMKHCQVKQKLICKYILIPTIPANYEQGEGVNEEFIKM